MSRRVNDGDTTGIKQDKFRNSRFEYEENTEPSWYYGGVSRKSPNTLGGLSAENRGPISLLKRPPPSPRPSRRGGCCCATPSTAVRRRSRACSRSRRERSAGTMGRKSRRSGCAPRISGGRPAVSFPKTRWSPIRKSAL